MMVLLIVLQISEILISASTGNDNSNDRSVFDAVRSCTGVILIVDDDDEC